MIPGKTVTGCALVVATGLFFVSFAHAANEAKAGTTPATAQTATTAKPAAANLAATKPAATKPADRKGSGAKTSSIKTPDVKTTPAAKASTAKASTAKPSTAKTPAAKGANSTNSSAKPATAKAPAPKAAAKPAATPPKATAVPLPSRRPAGGPMPTSPARAAAPKASVWQAPLAMAPTVATPTGDVATVKQVIELTRKNRPADATAAQAGISDPLARKLAEWVILRSDDNNVDFARYNAFIAANPGWPSIVTLRRRAEAMMWHERLPSGAVRAFFADAQPLSTRGHFALARALMSDGDRAGAQAQVRDAWRNDAFAADLEAVALELFGDLITRADEKARMEKHLYVNDTATALRAAARLGGHEPAIARARAAVNENSAKTSAKAKALLDAVPAGARHEAGFIFSHVQWLRRNDKIAEAGALILKAPRDPAHLHDLDEWWVERRLTARKLLDIGDARTAYRVVREAVPPSKDNYRIEHDFTAGWIALRFLNDPASAAQHFARIGNTATNPISLARAGYWQGRAAEAAGRRQEASAFYQAASRYPTAYYGQLARARLGLGDFTLARTSAADHRGAARLEVVRAAELLYAAGARDLLVPFMADIPDKTHDLGALVQLAELAQRNNDARAVLLVGKTGLGRGFPLDHYAFPTSGLPRYNPIGAEVEPAIVYSIARQESAFNPKVVSSANALGLMQVTPAAGRYIAKKHKVVYDQKRLLHDTVYNVQFGAAEIGDVIERYRGSYILAFAAYNAGSGRVKEWLERYGDPREPGVDAIDWVERIPFSETRNYVQRVMENLQVYRTRFGGGSRLMIEADLRRGAVAN